MKYRLAIIPATLLLFVLAYNSCGIAPDFSGKDNSSSTDGGGSSTVGNPKYTFDVAGYSAKVEIDICISQIRAEPAITPPQTVIPMNSARTITQTGMSLGSFQLDDLNYTKVNMFVEDLCGTGYGLRVRNDHGTFLVSAHNFQFLGQFTPGVSGPTLTLNLGQIAISFANATSEANVIDTLNDSTGSF